MGASERDLAEARLINIGLDQVLKFGWPESGPAPEVMAPGMTRSFLLSQDTVTLMGVSVRAEWLRSTVERLEGQRDAPTGGRPIWLEDPDGRLYLFRDLRIPAERRVSRQRRSGGVTARLWTWLFGTHPGDRGAQARADERAAAEMEARAKTRKLKGQSKDKQGGKDAQ